MDIAVLSFSKKKRLIHKTREWNRSPIISGVPDTSRAAAFFLTENDSRGEYDNGWGFFAGPGS